MSNGAVQPGAERIEGDAAWAARAERVRLDEIVSDLGRAAPVLDERRRAAMARLLDQLLQTTEDELRRHLAERLRGAFPLAAVALESGTVALVRPLLGRTTLLTDPDLIAVALRRADEHVLAGVLPADGPGAVLEDLVAASDPAVAAAALAVLIGEARRRDSFREPLLARTDLAAELQHRLVWRTAAALRTLLVAQHGLPVTHADVAAGEAAEIVLSGYDEEDRLEARATALARALADAEALRDDLIVGLFRAGHPIAAVAGLARRAGLSLAAAWDRLLAPDPAEPAQVLAAAGLGRQAAADLLLALHGPDRLAAGLARFEAVTPGHAWATLGLWRMDEIYRRTVADLVDRRRRA